MESVCQTKSLLFSQQQARKTLSNFILEFFFLCTFFCSRHFFLNDHSAMDDVSDNGEEEEALEDVVNHKNLLDESYIK